MAIISEAYDDDDGRDILSKCPKDLVCDRVGEEMDGVMRVPETAWGRDGRLEVHPHRYVCCLRR